MVDFLPVDLVVPPILSLHRSQASFEVVEDVVVGLEPLRHLLYHVAIREVVSVLASVAVFEAARLLAPAVLHS